VVRTEELNEKLFESLKSEFEDKTKKLITKYETRLTKLKEELELKLKVEIHELGERKNLHINELINNHEKAFSELKKYYNDITAENLNLIKSQKQEIARINANLNTNTKLINNMKSQNAALKGPLEEKTKIRNQLKDDLKQFEKNQMSLSNLKSKLIVLKEKIAKLKTDSDDLNQKYEKV
jgi:chromosome segregation ATPase